MSAISAGKISQQVSIYFPLMTQMFCRFFSQNDKKRAYGLVYSIIYAKLKTATANEN
jgi:uncharacterized protein (DUF2147 family)